MNTGANGKPSDAQCVECGGLVPEGELYCAKHGGSEGGTAHVFESVKFDLNDLWEAAS